MMPSFLPNKNRLALAALASALVLPCGMLRAAVLANYQFTGVVTSSTIPPNASLSGMSTGNPGSDPGVTITSSNNNVAWTQGISGGGTDSSAALAFTGNWYIEFTITPSADHALSLNSLTFNIGGTLGDTTQSFTANFFVRSNLVGTNYDTNVGSLQSWFVDQNSDNPGSNPLINNNPPASIDLSSFTEFQDVETAVTFRIYAYVSNANVVTKNTRPRLDNLVLDGDVAAVPEPGTVALAALGLGVLTIFRRKARALRSC